MPPAPASATASEAEAALLAVWHEYRASLVAKDGKRALAVVTPESAGEYERMRTLALTATRAELRELHAFDRYLALMLRARLPAEKLRSLDGRSLFVLCVDRDWVGPEIPREIRVKRIAGDVGYVFIVKDGREVRVEIPLMRQVEGQWRVDLVEASRFVRPGFAKILQELTKDKATDIDGAILFVIERLVGEKPKDSIWDPPR